MVPVLMPLHPALHGQDVVLAVAAMPTEGPHGDETTVGREAPQTGERKTERLGGLRRSQHGTVQHDQRSSRTGGAATPGPGWPLLPVRGQPALRRWRPTAGRAWIS